MTETCLRCRQPITRDSQVCEWKGQVWRCVAEDDGRVFEVNAHDAETGDAVRLLIKNGWGVNPVELLKDPYE